MRDVRSNGAGWVVVAALLAAGCDGDDAGGEGGGGGGGALTAESFDAALAEAYCKQLTTCARPGSDTSGILAFFNGDIKACASAFEAMAATQGAKALVADGKIAFDGTTAAACLEALAQDCDSQPSSIPACRETLRGLVPTGGACEDSIVCEGDSYCASGDDWRCGGTCAPRAKRGEACDGDGEACSQAEGPSVCSFDEGGSGGTCGAWERQVNPPAAKGEACTTWSFPGEPETPCAEGLACGGEDVCQEVLAEGAACTPEDICAVGLICQRAGEGGVCGRLTVVDAEGGACNETDGSQPLKLCNLFTGLVCVDSACVRSSGDVGAPCVRDLTNVCDDGLFCDEETVTCQARRANGEPCEGDDACQSGACDWEASTCVALTCE